MNINPVSFVNKQQGFNEAQRYNNLCFFNKILYFFYYFLENE